VTRVTPMRGRQVNRARDNGVQVCDGVIQKLDDVLATVGVSTRILLGGLVVVGRLEQSSGPAGIFVAIVCFVLLLSQYTHYLSRLNLKSI